MGRNPRGVQRAPHHEGLFQTVLSSSNLSSHSVEPISIRRTEFTGRRDTPIHQSPIVLANICRNPDVASKRGVKVDSKQESAQLGAA